jgi:hypothetical protein
MDRVGIVTELSHRRVPKLGLPPSELPFAVALLAQRQSGDVVIKITVDRFP